MDIESKKSSSIRTAPKRKKYCCVTSCENFKGTESDIRVFRFPKNIAMNEQWKESLGIKSDKLATGTICINHFKDTDFKRKDKYQVLLYPDSIPTIVIASLPSLPEQKIKNIDSTEIIEHSHIQFQAEPSEISKCNLCGETELRMVEMKLKHDIEIQRYKHKMGEMESKIKEMRNRLTKVNKNAYYLQTMKKKLVLTISELKKEKMLSDEAESELEAFRNNELLHILYKGVGNQEKYPANVRHFCIGLHFYSPRAYEHVRRAFNNHLPHDRTIRRWYQNSDIRSEPGIQNETVLKLKRIADDFQNTNGIQMICSLTFDEMRLRKQINWSIHEMDYVGKFAYERSNDIEREEILAPNEAIVFLLNGINASLEFPVAYHFITSLNTAEKKEMLQSIIEVVLNCGIKISNITFDGLATNISVCKLLGADLDVMSPNFQPCINIRGENIYIILDPCHMEKTVRNTLAGKGMLIDDENNKIEWRYIESLQSYTEKNDLLTHKLNKKHLQWRRNAMNVSLAVQTLSDSVANSLQFLMEQNHPEFKDATATIKFVRIMNKLFDIFNSKHLKSPNIFKCALNGNNKRIVFDFLCKTTSYLKTLKINDEIYVKSTRNPRAAKTKFIQKSILKSRNKGAFRGFIVNIHNLIHMYTTYVEENSLLTTIPTYYMLQDALELFFGRIRSCGGFNNNPNTTQFRGAYRKLQANMKIISSERGNCRVFDAELPSNFNFSNIYYVTSKRAAINPALLEESYNAQKDDILEEVVNLIQMKESDYLMDNSSNFSIAHLASVIEKKILLCPRFYCNDCKLVFAENEKFDTFSKNIIHATPCLSTVEICKNADNFFKLYDIRGGNSKFDFRVIYCMIFRSLNFQNLYPNSKFQCDPYHKYQFVKCIVGTYIALNASYVSKQYTLNQYKSIFRQQLNHLVLNSGQ